MADEEAREFVNDLNGARWDPETHILWLSPLFDWYKSDIEQDGQTVLTFVMKCLPEQSVREIRDAQLQDDFRIRYMAYDDWRMNDNKTVKNQPSTATSPGPSAPCH